MGNWAKQAKQALAQKDYIRAGDFFKLEGNYRSAVKAYLKAGQLGRAAEILESMGKAKRAEKLLIKEGTALDLAAFYVRQGDPAAATNVYLNNGMEFEAAELLEKSNQLHRAAEIYERLGFHEKAGTIFGKVKSHDRAITCLEIGIQKLRESGTPDAKARIERYRDWIANFHVAAGRYAKAADLFAQLVQFEKAAKSYAKADLPVKAAEYYNKLGKRRDAERLLENAEGPEARRMLGILATESGDYQRAIQFLAGTEHFQELGFAHEQLQQYAEAAANFEKIGDSLRAASLFARAGDHRKAALIYEEKGMYQESGESYEALEKYEHAARLFRLAKNNFKTGQCLYRCNRFDEALEELQKVESIDANILDAKKLMARIFFKQGYFSVATKVLEELTTQSTLTDENLSTYYLLARCLEELEDYAEAIRYYERICSRKVTYRDVRGRIERLNRSIGRPNQTKKSFDDSGVAPATLQVGDVIADRFRIVSQIGKGGMGFIYRVRDLALDRDVALKMLLHNRGSFEELKTELINARELTHPYIIKVFDIGEWKNVCYFTMELVEGETLKAYIERSALDQIEEKIKIVVKVCEGLHSAHEKGIIHRDIKPQNILLEDDLEPKILDFGIARRVSEDSKSQGISGSPKYMAPEQIQNTGADPRTDVYAIGIIMYYMFTKTEPFTGKDANQILLMQINKPIPDPMEVNKHVPYWLVEIIRRCCHKNKDMRYNNMHELTEELKLNILDFNP